MNTTQGYGEEIYGLIKQHTSGIALETLAKRYQVSPENPAVLISIAELLADGKIKTEMRGGKAVLCCRDERQRTVRGRLGTELYRWVW